MYKINPTESKIPNQNIKADEEAASTVVALDFESAKTVEIVNETVLFDFNSILAAVGGALGLFLGFSFHDCIMKSAAFCVRRYV